MTELLSIDMELVERHIAHAEKAVDMAKAWMLRSGGDVLAENERNQQVAVLAALVDLVNQAETAAPRPDPEPVIVVGDLVRVSTGGGDAWITVTFVDASSVIGTDADGDSWMRSRRHILEHRPATDGECRHCSPGSRCPACNQRIQPMVVAIDVAGAMQAAGWSEREIDTAMATRQKAPRWSFEVEADGMEGWNWALIDAEVERSDWAALHGSQDQGIDPSGTLQAICDALNTRAAP